MPSSSINYALFCLAVGADSRRLSRISASLDDSIRDAGYDFYHCDDIALSRASSFSASQTGRDSAFFHACLLRGEQPFQIASLYALMIATIVAALRKSSRRMRDDIIWCRPADIGRNQSGDGYARYRKSPFCDSDCDYYLLCPAMTALRWPHDLSEKSPTRGRPASR